MSWKDDYRKALSTFAVRNGTVQASFSQNPYDATYPDYGNGLWIREHLLACPFTVDQMEESTWWERADTFNEGTEAHGLDLVVTCSCGEVKGRRIRYEGSVGEILIGIFMEED